MEDDTIKLLRECNAGIKMGISSLEDVMPHVKNDHLENLLQQSRAIHCRLGDQTHEYLKEYHDEGKEPATMAKVMSWMKTNVKFTEEDSDRVVADLITDGCNMGVKSLYRYLHQYRAAKPEVKKLAKEAIEVEETLIRDMREYL